MTNMPKTSFYYTVFVYKQKNYKFCEKLSKNSKMLRQVSRLFLVKPNLKSISRPLCQGPTTEYFEESLLPKYSKEGIPMRDPRDINDPDYDKPVKNVASENFSFDTEHGIGQVRFCKACFLPHLISFFFDRPISKKGSILKNMSVNSAKQGLQNLLQKYKRENLQSLQIPKNGNSWKDYCLKK